MMINLKTEAELEKLYQANQIVASVLSHLAEQARPGIDTLKLDRIAERMCREAGGIPAFLNYPGQVPYPASICASINEEIVHGIPSKDRILKEGDILSIDFGVCRKGYFGDSAITVPIGRVSPETTRLLDATRKSLDAGIEQAVVGNRLYDISHAIQKVAENAGFSVVRDFVGHGIGKKMHEPPQIPNYGEPGQGIRLKAGMVLALEPMVNVGTWKIRVKDDGWTAVTADGKLSAHFEHSVAITDNGPRVLSLRKSKEL